MVKELSLSGTSFDMLMSGFQHETAQHERLTVGISSQELCDSVSY